MTPQEILLKCADDFEANPKSWIRGVFVTDAAGSPLIYSQNDQLIDRAKRGSAACFCAVGKIYQVAENQKEADEAVTLLGEMLKTRYFPNRDWFLPQDCVVSFNDQLNRPEQLIENMREAAKTYS